MRPPRSRVVGTAVSMELSTAVTTLLLVHCNQVRSLISSVLAVRGLSDIHSEHSQSCVARKTRGELKNKLAEVVLRESVQCELKGCMAEQSSQRGQGPRSASKSSARKVNLTPYSIVYKLSDAPPYSYTFVP